MHDTYLLNKISKSLKEVCDEHKLKWIDSFVLVVSHQSHIDEASLREHLEFHNKDLLGENLQIEIHREDIEEQTAIIHSLKGEAI